MAPLPCGTAQPQPIIDAVWDDPSGNAIYRNAPVTGKDPMRTSREETNAALQQAGIPGIKYLDQGSRTFVEPRIQKSEKGFEVYWGNDANPVDVFPDEASAKNAAAQLDTRSRNYVVFDDSLVEILRKYGLVPGMLGAGALANMQSGDGA